VAFGGRCAIKLGGSIFVRNAIKFDYCIIESLTSLLGVCDHVVVLECSSDDNTAKLLRKYKSSKLTLITDVYWPIAPDASRLAMLANMAKGCVDCDTHVMLQADEVIHEKSYDAIRRLAGVKHSVSVRRVNFYGDPSRHVRYDIDLHLKPCDDHPTRIGPHALDALGDGESILKVDDVFDESIVFCHYGFVRDGLKLVDRTVASLEWFHNPPQMDNRFVQMQADRKYRYKEIMADDLLTEYQGTHPKLIQPWLQERWQ
jgi:hypothetical protein